MDSKINIENFKQIMGLRESFASNRKQDKIEILSFHFNSSEKLAVLKQGHRVEFLKVNDQYKDKDFGRKLKLISAYQQK